MKIPTVYFLLICLFSGFNVVYAEDNDNFPSVAVITKSKPENCDESRKTVNGDPITVHYTGFNN